MERRYYPCEIIFEEGIYYVQFIDFENGFTDGETFKEALHNAHEVLSALIFSMVKHGIELPEPSEQVPGKNVVYVDIWLDPIIDRVNNQTIKKTLTIPKWLNDEAEAENINFSSALQTALKQSLNII